MDRFNVDHYLDKRFQSLDLEKVNHDNELFFKVSNILNNKNISYFFVNENTAQLDFKDGLNIVLVNYSVNQHNSIVLTVNKNSKIIWIELNAKNSCVYNNNKFEVKADLEFIKIHLGNHVKSNVKNNFWFFIGDGYKLNFKAFSMVATSYVLDDAVELIHNGNNAFSNLDYYSFLSGKIVTQVNTTIEKNAINNESHQNLKHILLEKSSQCFSKPNLQIENNKVVASHGNAVSTLSKNDLFYLMQRGLNYQNCLSLIMSSRLSEVIDNEALYKLIVGLDDE